MLAVFSMIFVLRALPFIPGMWLNRPNYDSVLALAFALSVFSVVFFVVTLMRAVETWVALCLGAVYFALLFFQFRPISL
jgi:hypothetical protein